ncbi:hypothetical protein DSM106972_094750 [Dulcicalothrix desertica PCC 7102]|uniref:DUF488 domain-containing protein n=1 Tax=Dulcicalothrix desertica PCC 7102 TaxID=232991 RepID=A0A3S1BZQ3_9CYAN|nr:DUF488 domain-containing protein [Dulcicalothrix desertica]RUS94004.1 hypothetical protein DSM106972_094750 [Dulcicalothrix desertica PCC 7102]TWH62685.1 hypothetical protein CAL7102_00192 [Dulcicalothrix desertica PCC 7102]
MICKDINTNNYILTFGYGNRKDYDEFIQYLKSFDVRYVIDVRNSPRAWSRKWYGQEIQSCCESQNVKYISMPALGNTSGNSKWIPPSASLATQALEEVSKIIQSETCLLLCAELQSARCHRTEVALKLHELTKLPVRHLE